MNISGTTNYCMKKLYCSEMSKSILAWQALSWLALCGVSILFVFKVKLHSDILFFDDFLTDIFYLKGSIHDWKFPPAPAFFPEISLYWLSLHLFDSVAVRVAFVSGVQAVLLAYLCIYLANTIKPELTSASKSLIILLVTLVAFASLHSEMWLFFYSNNIHFSALLCSLAGLSLVIKFMDSGKYKYLIGILGVVVAGGISSSLNLLTFSIPIIILIIIWAWFSRGRVWRLATPVVMSFLIGHLVASVILSSLVRFSSFDGRVRFTLVSLEHSLAMLREAIKVSFSPDNITTLLLSGLFLIILIWLNVEMFSRRRVRVFAKYNELPFKIKLPVEMPRLDFLYYFWVLSLFITVLGAILSGVFADPYAFRYFAVPICIGILLWVLVIDINGLFEKLISKIFTLISLGLFVVAVGGVYQNIYVNKKNTLNDALLRGAPYLEAEKACLNKIKNKGFLLRSGIADYWDARGLRYKLNDGTYILPVLHNGDIFFHIKGFGQLAKPLNYQIEKYNFVILRKSNTQSQFNLTPETLGSILPRPDVVIGCESSEKEVWIYLDWALDKVVNEKIDKFLLSIGIDRHHDESDKHWDFTGTNLSNQVGHRTQSGVISDGRSGYLMYGPYISRRIGQHIAIVDLVSNADINGSVTMDVVSNGGQYTHSKSTIALDSSTHSLVLPFELLANVVDLEVRLLVDADTKVGVKKLTVKYGNHE